MKTDFHTIQFVIELKYDISHNYHVFPIKFKFFTHIYEQGPRVMKPQMTFFSLFVLIVAEGACR